MKLNDIQPPYSYTIQEINDLPEISFNEASLWNQGNRKKAINDYKLRTKIEDKKIIAWLFFTCSTIANNLVNK